MEPTKNQEEIYNRPLFVFKKVSLVDKYNFYEYIAVMLDGGIGVSESLASVKEKVTSVYFKEKISEISTFIYSGDSFSKAMKKVPGIFSINEISVIEAGETTGNLIQAMEKLSIDLKKIHNLRNRVKSALTYPAIIFLFLLIAIVVVLVYVIPAIKPLFDTTKTELPAATKAMIFTSDFISTNFLLIFLFFFTSFVLFIGYKNTRSGKISIEHFILGLPLIGKVYKNYILSSIASTLGTLIGSGINVVKTLELVGKSTDNTIYEALIEEVSIKVSKGEKIVDSMREVDPDKRYFPGDFTQMLSVGERTASLDKISEKVADQYEKEVDYSLANLTKWIEPMAILVAGIFVLWFAFAIFGAILKVTQTVG